MDLKKTSGPARIFQLLKQWNEAKDYDLLVFNVLKLWLNFMALKLLNTSSVLRTIFKCKSQVFKSFFELYIINYLLRSKYFLILLILSNKDWFVIKYFAFYLLLLFFFNIKMWRSPWEIIVWSINNMWYLILRLSATFSTLFFKIHD